MTTASPDQFPILTQKTFEERSHESSLLRRKHPERVPVVVAMNKSCKNLAQIDKQKFLVPADLTLGQFMFVIRKRLVLDSSQAIYVFTKDGVMPPTSALMSSVYQDNRDPDGFLYMTYASENTFGSA